MKNYALPPGAQNNHPLDIETMRATADGMLAQGTGLPRHDNLEEALLLLRGHLALIVPETKTLARSLPEGHMAGGPALAAVAQVRVRLAAGPGSGLVSAVEHARGLARELRTLCDHYEALAGTGTEQQV